MNPTESEIKNLEKLWNEDLPTVTGVIRSSQTPAPVCIASCEQVILYAWSPMPVLKKQKAVQ